MSHKNPSPKATKEPRKEKAKNSYPTFTGASQGNIMYDGLW